MHLSTAFLALAALLAASVSSVPVRRDVPVDLIPQFGLQAGVNPTGTGDCDGLPNAQGVPIKIPCACPPDRNSFIQKLNANVAAGHVLTNPSVHLTFPTDSSKGAQNARLNAAAVTLQNLNGPGKGCPVVSTTFPLQQQAIDAGQDPNKVVAPQPGKPAATTKAAAPPPNTPPPAPAPAKPTTPAAVPPPAASPVKPGQVSQAQIAALAPPLGFHSGVNPTGTGDCDGAVNGTNGKPIKVPCACPPTQDVYIKALTANVNANKAINNPSVKVTFPLGNSKQDQAGRVEAAIVTLQNLNGPGKGCPVVSTTLGIQQKALQG